MAKITRDEALLVIKKWFDEATSVRCDFSFDRISGCVRGKIVKFDGQDLTLLCPDTMSELSIRVGHDTAFAYGGQNSPDDPENVVALVFPYGPGQERQDSVNLSDDYH